MPKPLVVAIVGPTCTGKTDLAIEIATRLNGEIVACDSRTVYKYMDIGTAKPTATEQRGITHHMLDLVEPTESYTAANYKADGTKCLQEILQRGQLPIVCGGTGFYSRALLEGFKIPEVLPQEDLRNELKDLAEREGVEKVREILAQIDPDSLSTINERDLFRMTRAIEVTRVLGIPFSRAKGREEVPFDVLWFALGAADRELLKKRITERMDRHLEIGVFAEIEALYKRFGKVKAIVNAVPYKEYVQYIEGELSLDDARLEAIKHNMELARRQTMWFRANKQICWHYSDKSEMRKILDNCLIEISSKLAQKVV